MKVPYKYALSLLMKMDYNKIKNTPSIEGRIETLRVYYVLGEVTIRLAAYIRSLGYQAKAFLPSTSKHALLHIPFAVASGLGELGKAGVLLTEQFGSCLRLGTVTTNLTLKLDAFKKRGLADFCERCGICAKKCPSAAISHEKQIVRGVKKHITNPQECNKMLERIKPKTCLVCIRVCPLNSLENKKKWISKKFNI
jgi:epoxyqueuosine reductase QueG